MCSPLSFYGAVINDAVKVWISDRTDSHRQIAEEFGIRDKGIASIWAGEIHPDWEKPSPDPATWILDWDSEATFGTRPEPDEATALRIRAELEKQIRKYIVTTGEHHALARLFLFGDAKLTSCSGGAYFFCGSSQNHAPNVGWSSFYGSGQNHAPNVGWSSFYDSSQNHAPNAGQSLFYGSSQNHAQNTGASWFYGSSQNHAANVGVSRFLDSSEDLSKQPPASKVGNGFNAGQ